jgi:hypothetical protein
MKYETPELTALTPAISAIQSDKIGGNLDHEKDVTASYEDWED